MDLLERVQKMDIKIFRGIEHFFYKKHLRDLGLFGPEKRRLWEDLSAPSSI